MIASLNQEINREEADYKRALAAAPYHDDARVATQTAALVEKGHAILQIHRLARGDREHCAALLALFDPPPGARVLDAGCGVGRVADLMRQLRPDLEMVMLNISRAQLAMCSAGIERHEGSFEAIPLPDGSVDAAMYLYSLGHGRLSLALAEAARVIRRDGVLFIYDLTAEDSGALIDTLGYKAHRRDDVEDAAVAAGFSVSLVVEPEGTDLTAFHEILPPEHYAAIFAGVRPIAYRFERR